MPITYKDLGLIEADLSAANTQTDYTVSRPFNVVDASAVAIAAQAGGTLTVARQPAAGGGFNATTSAMTCAVISDLGRTSAVVEAQRSFLANDTLRLTPGGGGAVNGRARLLATFEPILGAA